MRKNKPVSEPWSVCHPHEEDMFFSSSVELLQVVIHLLIYYLWEPKECIPHYYLFFLNLSYHLMPFLTSFTAQRSSCPIKTVNVFPFYWLTWASFMLFHFRGILVLGLLNRMAHFLRLIFQHSKMNDRNITKPERRRIFIKNLNFTTNRCVWLTCDEDRKYNYLSFVGK